MSGFTRFPVFLLLPLILGCFISSSKASPLSHESNEELENDDLVKSGYRNLQERVSFVSERKVQDEMSPEPEDSLTGAGYREPEPQESVPQAAGSRRASFAAEHPVISDRNRKTSIVLESSSRKSLRGEFGALRKSLRKSLKKVFDVILTEIQDESKWDVLKTAVIKLAETLKKGLDFVSEIPRFT